MRYESSPDWSTVDKAYYQGYYYAFTGESYWITSNRNVMINSFRNVFDMAENRAAYELGWKDGCEDRQYASIQFVEAYDEMMRSLGEAEYGG